MDAYDHMVAYLTENPKEILEAWRHTCSHKCGALFQYAVPSPIETTMRDDGINCGCLTMIRNPQSSFGHAWTDALTIAVRADERIPTYSGNITPDHLPIFAGWQRRIDAILNRTPPVWNGPPCAKPEVEMGANVEVELQLERDE